MSCIQVMVDYDSSVLFNDKCHRNPIFAMGLSAHKAERAQRLFPIGVDITACEIGSDTLTNL